MAQVESTESIDSVVEEMRRIKDALAREKGFDVSRILDEARQSQDQGNRLVLRPADRETSN